MFVFLFFAWRRSLLQMSKYAEYLININTISCQLHFSWRFVVKDNLLLRVEFCRTVAMAV